MGVRLGWVDRVSVFVFLEKMGVCSSFEFEFFLFFLLFLVELDHFLVVKLNHMLVFIWVSQFSMFRWQMVLEFGQKEGLNDFLYFVLFSPVLIKLLKNIHLRIEVLPEMPQLSIPLIKHKVKQVNPLHRQTLKPTLHVRPHHQYQRNQQHPYQLPQVILSFTALLHFIIWGYEFIPLDVLVPYSDFVVQV
jgi:hypothetical protein